MFSFTVAAVVFGVVFLAELPDKTALAGLMLGTRYRASYVFAGVAAAFAIHVGIAIAAGSVLGLLPHRLLQTVVGVLSS
ncbi:putative integral membrane protein, partial [Streptomyces himastatinicus ATCC 53653]